MTKLEKLKQRLSKLESDLYEERCKQHNKLGRMGWGHAMRNVKCSISTRREDSIKDKSRRLNNR